MKLKRRRASVPPPPAPQRYVRRYAGGCTPTDWRLSFTPDRTPRLAPKGDGGIGRPS